MRALLLSFGALAPVFAQSTPQFRGVNLGGWFVLESWIYPEWWNSLGVPDGVGEWQFIQTLGSAKATAALASTGGHWDQWVGQQDLVDLAAAGITHLRIPVGYWILGGSYIAPGEPYLTGQWPYLLRALGWAKQLGMQAVIDLHGAPGSQNGHDNSGFSGAINWDKGDNINRTIAVLAALAGNCTAINAAAETAGVIAGIELLNEPWTTFIGGPIDPLVYKDFTQRAVDAVRGAGWAGDIWLSDAWNLLWSEWTGFLAPPAYTNIYFDTHQYHAFDSTGPSLAWSFLNTTCNADLPHLASATAQDWVIVGEWSLGLPGFVKAPMGAQDSNLFFRAWFEAQLQAYGAGSAASGSGPVKGGFFWNFKTTESLEWSYLDGIRLGYIPRNLTALAADPTAFDCAAIKL